MIEKNKINRVIIRHYHCYCIESSQDWHEWISINFISWILIKKDTEMSIWTDQAYLIEDNNLIVHGLWKGWR